VLSLDLSFKKGEHWRMDRQFDVQKQELKTLILTMGGQVERALEVVKKGLFSREASKLQEVFAIEEEINKAHVRVDENCLSFLAKQGPVAKDLRFLVSLIKINCDLERMGDQCVNIALTGKDFLSHPMVTIPPEIFEMADLVQKMIKDSLDSFVREDEILAKSILLMDDEVDIRKDSVLKSAIQRIQVDPKLTTPLLDLILMARNFERLGDHATNIAEDVIFVSTGKDVRHGGRFSS
jgi:phosphate transport system protein